MDRSLVLLCALAGVSFIEGVAVFAALLDPATSVLEFQTLVFALVWLMAVFTVCIAVIILFLFGASGYDDGPKGRESLPEENPTPLEMRGRSIAPTLPSCRMFSRGRRRLEGLCGCL